MVLTSQEVRQQSDIKHDRPLECKDTGRWPCVGSRWGSWMVLFMSDDSHIDDSRVRLRSL